MFSDADRRFRFFVAIYRCDAVTSGPTAFVCDETKIEIFREERTYWPSAYRAAVIATVKGAEYCFPAQPPLPLDSRCQHIVLSTRTRLDRGVARAACEAQLDRVVALLSAIVSPDLFRTLLYRGWLQGGPPGRDFGVLFKPVEPIVIDEKSMPQAFAAAFRGTTNHPGLSEKFDLMARFIAKGLAEPPGEEAYVSLWTALEVFPMVGTSDIRPISEFLSGYLKLPVNQVKEKLQIGWLFGMRGKLVHDGHLPLDEMGQYQALSRLERVVRAVVRHASGLPYDGALDRELETR